MDCVATKVGLSVCNATEGTSSVFAKRYESAVDLWVYAQFDLAACSVSVRKFVALCSSTALAKESESVSTKIQRRFAKD